MTRARRRSRITIQEPGTGRTPGGTAIAGWVDVVRPWANILVQNGKEFISAGGEMSVVAASIRIPYRVGITAGMRVVHRTTVYSIAAVLPDEQGHKHVDLVCTTGANKG